MSTLVWRKIVAIPPVVAAVLAVASAVVAVSTWVTGYFATQRQLEFVKCVSDGNEELLSLQLETQNAYSNYVNHKIRIADLQARKDTVEDFHRLINEAQAEANIHWESLTRVKTRADELAASLRTGKCGTETTGGMT